MSQNNAIKINLIDCIKDREVFNIIDLVQHIDIYEDMYSTYLTCNLSIMDTNNFMRNIVGNETISISLTDSRQRSFNYEFRIYNIEIGNEKSNKQLYTLNLINPDALTVNSTKISDIYGNTSTTIIDKILTTDKKKNFDIDNKNMSLLIPNLNVFSAINFVASLTENYIFFENKEGYQYRDIQKMVQQESSYEYVYLNSKTPSEEQFYNILEFDTPYALNILDNLNNNMYYKKIILNNLKTGATQDIIYDYGKEFIKTNSFGDKGFVNFQNYQLNKDIRIGNRSDLHTSHTFKHALLQQFQNNKNKLFCNGNFELTTGKCLTINSGNSLNRYLITSVHHSITKTSYNCYVELSSNSA
jgi:uncharacterized protein YsxB (DUF464 family)